MMIVEWGALGLGFAAGAVTGTVFFAGLALGLQHALKRANPMILLALSAVVRIGLVLGGGWLVVSQAGPWAFAGYGLAFLIARRAAITLARVGAPARCPE